MYAVLLGCCFTGVSLVTSEPQEVSLLCLSSVRILSTCHHALLVYLYNLCVCLSGSVYARRGQHVPRTQCQKDAWESGTPCSLSKDSGRFLRWSCVSPSSCVASVHLCPLCCAGCLMFLVCMFPGLTFAIGQAFGVSSLGRLFPDSECSLVVYSPLGGVGALSSLSP